MPKATDERTENELLTPLDKDGREAEQAGPPVADPFATRQTSQAACTPQLETAPQKNGTGAHPSSRDGNSPSVDELLARWDEARQQGQKIDADELCLHSPEQIDEVKRRIEALQSMEGFLNQGPRSRQESALLGRSTIPSVAGARAAVSAEPRPADEELVTRPPAMAPDFSSTPPAGIAADKYPTLSSAGTSPQAPDGTITAAIPGYEILGELGRGGMGVVYKARHVSLKRLVALKMILAGGYAGEGDKQRFRTEAEAVARLRHPGIVQIYDIGEVAGNPYFSLEYCDGGSLAKKLGGTPLPPREAAEVVQSLACAMQAAHDAGIIHRDLKPANILLVSGGFVRSEPGQAGHHSPLHHPPLTTHQPKITDFGLAKKLDEAGQTASGAVMGTPSYMAPEQAGGKGKEVGPAADIYALGAILYECLSGRPPFKAASAMDTILQVLADEPVPPSRLNPKVPRDLERICLKCLQKEPGKRYRGAEDLAADLGRYLRGEPVHARAVSRMERTWKWARRRPAVAALWGVVIIASLGLAGVVFWHFDDLQSQLTEARADEQQALAAKTAAEERLQVAKLEGDVRNLAAQSRDAIARADWVNATVHIRNALARITQAESTLDLSQGQDLAKLRVEAESLRQETERYEKARTDYVAFLRGRDDALFYQSAVTGLDAATNRRRARDAARQGVRLFVSDDGTPVVPDKYFSRSERSEILGGCYQLFLLWAESVASPAVEHEGDYATALVLLDRAAKLHAATRAYHLRRARYLGKLGKRADAQKEREQALALPPADDLDSFLLGEDEFRQGNVVEAVRHLNAAVTANPKNFWAHYFLGVAYMSPPQPRSDLARASFTSCLSLGLKQDFPWVYLLRAFAAGDLGDFAAAEADFARAQTLTLDPEARCGLLVNRGYLRVLQAKAVPADDLTAACGLLFANPAPLEAGALVAQKYRRKKLDDAVADLHQAVDLKPDQYSAYINLAQTLRMQKKLPDAIAQLDKALGKNAKLSVLYRERAQIHMQEDHTAEALRDLDRAIELENGKASKAGDLVQKAQILYRQGRHAQALAAAREALSAQPAHARAHLLSAQASLLLGSYADALASLNQFERFGQPSAAFHVARGRVRGKLGNHRGAVDDFTQALALKPDTATYIHRGWAYLLALRSPRPALADFEEALRRAPDHGEAHSGRGNARVLLGLYQDAVTDADASLRLGPTTPRLLTGAARIFAQAAAQVRAAAPWSNRAAMDTADRFQQRALTLLRQAVTSTPEKERVAFWRNFIEPDIAFRDLWRSAEYARLAGLAAAAAPKVEN